VTYRIAFTRQAKRALDVELPESVAAACAEFIYGVLAENPHRVGKQLTPPHYPSYAARRGDFRVIYDIEEEKVVVTVINVRHRRDVYRTPS
jgi:mRNA interferase RelE/StbE